jgi:cysteine desulfurase
MRGVYLDNNATTPVDPDVLAAMLPFFTERFGNPSSAHGAGATVADAMRAARRAVRALIGAAAEQEIVFTSGGTEGDNAAILSALATAPQGRNEVVVSAVEHPAVLSLCDHLERARGVVLHRVPVDRLGRIDIAAYRAAVGPRTAIVSVMWANNETGTVFPIAELAAVARQAGALFHTDAVQAVGKLPIAVSELPVDMLSLSGHKLHAPKGVGVLYVRNGTAFRPLLWGGRQERARRGGTENVPAIVGLGRAAEIAAERMAATLPRIRALRDRLEVGIVQRIADCWMVGDPDPSRRLGNTALMVFDRAEAEPILDGLNAAGICASSGSACASGSVEPSHVLKAMRVPFTAAHGAVRFSFAHDNGPEDVDRVLEVLPDIVARARAVSLFAGSAPEDDHARMH